MKIGALLDVKSPVGAPLDNRAAAAAAAHICIEGREREEEKKRSRSCSQLIWRGEKPLSREILYTAEPNRLIDAPPRVKRERAGIPGYIYILRDKFFFFFFSWPRHCGTGFSSLFIHSTGSFLPLGLREKKFSQTFLCARTHTWINWRNDYDLFEEWKIIIFEFPVC